mgnify:CR=1 FL=1
MIKSIALEDYEKKIQKSRTYLVFFFFLQCVQWHFGGTCEHLSWDIVSEQYISLFEP